MIIAIIVLYIAVGLFCVLLDVIQSDSNYASNSDRWEITKLFALLTVVCLSITGVGLLLGIGFKIIAIYII